MVDSLNMDLIVPSTGLGDVEKEGLWPNPSGCAALEELQSATPY